MSSVHEDYNGPYPVNEWERTDAGSVAMIDVPPEAAPKKPRRKLRLSPKEKDRRSKHIAKFQHLAVAASLAAITPEKRKEIASMGREAQKAKYNLMKAATSPDTPDGFRLRRIDLEGKRDWLLDKLIECAETETELPALSVLRAALTEIRAEIPILLDREERATKAAAAAPRAGESRAAIGPAVQPATVQPAPPSSVATLLAGLPGNSPVDILQADISTVIPPQIAAD